MILPILFLTVFMVTSEAFRPANEEYKVALTSTCSNYGNILKSEYVKYFNTGIKSSVLASLTASLAHSPDLARVEVEKLSISHQMILCTVCNSAVSLLLDYVHGEYTPQEIRDLFLGLCVELKIETERVCTGVIDLNWPAVEYIFTSRPNLTEEAVCGVILQGSNCANSDPSFEWSVNVDENGEKTTKSKEIASGPTENDITILHLTDIHYDPLYTPGALAACNEPLCCIDTSENWNGTEKGAGRWSDYRSCDVSDDLFLDTLKHIREQHTKIDYVYFTGDIIEHAVWKTSVKSIEEVLTYVYDTLEEAFGDIPVFPLVGNHESNPLNLFAPDYVTRSDVTTRWLYNHLSKLWTKWLPESTIETIKQDGYYTVSPHKGFRIIALNNNDCYTFNFWILFDPGYLVKQLQWLHDTLLDAEKAGEHVHILAHIPSGAGSCFNTWSREYRRIIERFHRIIGGIFNGHTHFDEFNVFYSRESPSHAINVGWNGGSLTPFSFVNPNYRMYTVETESYQVVTHDTWSFNLTLANLNPDQGPAWFKEYSFLEAYGLKDMSPASLDKLLENLASDPKLLQKYWEYKVKLGDPSLEKGCNDDCLAGHLCEIATTQYNDMERCQQLEATFRNSVAKARRS